MLELQGIHYQPATSEKVVLENIDLQVRYGKPAIIAGPSGSGKTSLVEIISGLAKPQRGTFYLEEQVLNQRQRRSHCGVVFQFPERHFLGLSIAQELRLGHRRLSGEQQSMALRRVGLANIDVRQAPERLSGGQQRRLAVAVQLLRNPKILLLDEPTAGLDWSVREEVLGLLAKISEQQILIVVTHEPELFKNWKVSEYSLLEGKLKNVSTLPKGQ